MKALVLAGGGSKGAFQVGVLKRWMAEEGKDYDIMCGVSVGALNVAGLSQTPKGDPKSAQEWLENFWLTKITGTKSVYKRWFPFGRLHSLWLKSIYDSSPLMKLVKDNMDMSKVSMNGRKLAVGAVCLDTGEHAFGTEQDSNFADWVLGSSSFPVFLTPIEINGKLWSDGGIVNITPLGQAIRMGADEVDVILCSDPWAQDPWTATRKVAVPDIVIRTLELMNDQIAKNDLEEVGLKNDLASINPKYRKVTVRVVMPSTPLPTDALTFDPATIREMMKQGYDDATKVMLYG